MNRRDKQTDFEQDIAFLNELTRARRAEGEPSRWEYVLKVLKEKGFQTTQDNDNKCIRFSFRGNVITVWPYTGWFSGKGVKDGRGIKKLLKQI